MRAFLVGCCALALSGCTLDPFMQQAGLKVTASPEATVFLDGAHIGKTPLEQQELRPGEYTVRVSTDTQSVVRKVRLVGGTWTHVNVEFGPDQEQIAGETVSLDKGQGLIVTSLPDGATVLIDTVVKGVTPLALRSIDPGVHTINLEKEGYHPRGLANIKIAKDKLVTVHAQLARVVDAPTPQVATPAATPASGRNKEARIVIKETGTGWLRVRESPSLSGREIEKVNVGEEFTVKEEQSGWVKIKLPSSGDGWVSAQFVEKQ